MVLKNAFTLIELIIVISIMGIALSSIAPPVLRFQSAISLNGAACQMLSELNLTKQKAISSGQVYELFCKAGFYTVRKQNIASNSFDEIIKVNLPDNIFFANPLTFRFAVSGFPIPGYFGTTYLVNNHKYSKKIIVSSIGRIRID